MGNATRPRLYFTVGYGCIKLLVLYFAIDEPRIAPLQRFPEKRIPQKFSNLPRIDVNMFALVGGVNEYRFVLLVGKESVLVRVIMTRTTPKLRCFDSEFQLPSTSFPPLCCHASAFVFLPTMFSYSHSYMAHCIP